MDRRFFGSIERSTTAGKAGLPRVDGPEISGAVRARLASRRQGGGSPGLYLTLEQSAYLTPIAQGAIFAFSSRDVG